jgi:NADPH-dependent 2,4-dienoyl-CoA reductase/sulfur reductase-like enzyme
VVAPEQIPLTPVFGERIGRWVQHRHTDKGVRFHLAHTVKEIRGDGRVREVVLDDDTRIKTDLIIIGVGILPAVDFLSGSGLVEKGEIPVDSRFRTGVEGIYACGDIAAIPDPVTGEIRRVEHWVEAERQGQHAARAMLDSPEPYSEIPFFWTRQYGKSLKYIGYARRFDSVVFRGTTDDGRFIAGLYEKGALRAAAAAGYARELITIGQMLKEGKNLDPERLSDPDFTITG